MLSENLMTKSRVRKTPTFFTIHSVNNKILGFIDIHYGMVNTHTNVFKILKSVHILCGCVIKNSISFQQKTGKKVGLSFFFRNDPSKDCYWRI